MEEAKTHKWPYNLIGGGGGGEEEEEEEEEESRV